MSNCEFCGQPSTKVITIKRWGRVMTEVAACDHCQTLFQRLMAIAGLWT